MAYKISKMFTKPSSIVIDQIVWELLLPDKWMTMANVNGGFHHNTTWKTEIIQLLVFSSILNWYVRGTSA